MSWEFASCGLCGVPGHKEADCALKTYYHIQAQRQVAKGSRDPEILREVYGERLERQRAHQC